MWFFEAEKYLIIKFMVIYGRNAGWYLFGETFS